MEKAYLSDQELSKFWSIVVEKYNIDDDNRYSIGSMENNIHKKLSETDLENVNIISIDVPLYIFLVRNYVYMKYRNLYVQEYISNIMDHREIFDIEQKMEISKDNILNTVFSVLDRRYKEKYNEPDNIGIMEREMNYHVLRLYKNKNNRIQIPSDDFYYLVRYYCVLKCANHYYFQGVQEKMIELRESVNMREIELD